MTTPSDAQQPNEGSVVKGGSEPPLVRDVPESDPTPPVGADWPPPIAERSAVIPEPEKSEQDSGGKLKAAAVLAGAAALANKVRQEAPKKVQGMREKRAAGRCVILAELGGRQVAIGPYRDDQGARQDVVKVSGAAKVVELLSQDAYFRPGETEQLA